MNRKEIRREIRQVVPWIILFAIIAIVFVAGFVVGINAICGVGGTDGTSNAYLNATDDIATHRFVWPEPTESNLISIGTMHITGYDPFCDHCCGKHDGITASGEMAEIGYTAAMAGYPFGTKIYIDGLGVFEVQDRGVSDNAVDIACADHAACYAITGEYQVYLIK